MCVRQHYKTVHNGGGGGATPSCQHPFFSACRCHLHRLYSSQRNADRESLFTFAMVNWYVLKKNLKSGVYIFFSFTLGYKIYSCRSPIYVHIYKCGNGSVKSIHAGRFVNTYIPYTIGSDGEVDLISLLTLWMGNVMRMPPLGEDVKKLCTVHPQMLKTKQKNLDNFFRLKKKQDLHVENALGYLSS